MPESGETGLLVLAKEEDSGGQTDPFTVDIVAIHGVNGHRTKSWSPENGETSQKTWLEDILAARIPSARIMTFGYDSGATTAGDLLSSSGLRKVAIELLNALCGKRTGKNNLPLIFLCHSLGGLIVKELMCIANDDSFYFSIAARTEHLIFFGTPHQNTDSSSWETLLFDIALACTEGSPYDRRKILTSMIRIGPATLIEVSKRFSSLPWHYRILSFYEEKVSQSVGLVVRLPLHMFPSATGSKPNNCSFGF
ncbi:hypothetical protein K440DRAFT_188013 [Wilcoxina mikolae CBS 423.85]|nr:hypothetical protein K440DRAFT_188013 [Wilcoxina mikolae CBS 423.85]